MQTLTPTFTKPKEEARLKNAENILRILSQRPDQYTYIEGTLRETLGDIQMCLGKDKAHLSALQRLKNRINRQKNPSRRQIKNIIVDTKELVQAAIKENRIKIMKGKEDQIKEKICVMRNMLQELTLAILDATDRVRYWNQFKDLIQRLRDKDLSPEFSEIIKSHIDVIAKWQDYYDKHMKNDGEIMEITENKETRQFAKDLEAVLDEITHKMDEWEIEMKLI